MQSTELTSVSLLKSKWNLKKWCSLGTAVFIMSVSSTAHATDDHDSSNTPSSKWSGYFGIGYTQNSYKSSAYNAYKAYDFKARIKYADDWGDIRLTGGGQKEAVHGRESSYFDPFLEYRLPLYDLSETVSIRGTAGVYLPASETSQKDHLQYAPRLAAYIYWQPQDQLIFYVAPRYRYNAYNNKTAGGKVLTEHQLELLTDAYWQINAAWYVEISGSYTKYRNYNGRRLDNTFTFAQELGWEFQPSWELAIGHNNSGKFYDPEVGPSQGFKAFNKKSSTFYLSLTKYL